MSAACPTIERVGNEMTNVDSIRYEIEGRMLEISNDVGKFDLSIRWEPMARIARVGFLVQNYEWAARMKVVEVATAFQNDHLDDFAVDFDVIPYESVLDSEFAEA